MESIHIKDMTISEIKVRMADSLLKAKNHLLARKLGLLK